MKARVLYVRVSDNVLSDEDFAVRRILIENGTVVGHTDLNPGVYGFDFMPNDGWTLDQVLNWTSYDPTGQHPEVYHEVRGVLTDHFTSCYHMEDLVKML